MLTSQLQAQADKRCSLVSKKCIDPEKFNGKTFSFPENVTRFNKEGLTFCAQTQEVVIQKPPAILYIMDQSSSMRNSGGDPHTIRGTSIVEAIKRQKELYPESAAGIIEFSGSLTVDGLYQKEILALSDNDHFQDLINNVSAKVSSGTNYIDALKKADDFMGQVTDDYNPYVIFITDGQPMGSNDRNEILTLSNSFDQHHTFFLGVDDAAGRQLLKDMSEPTGGAYHHINSTNPSEFGDTLETVVDYLASQGEERIIQVEMSKYAGSSKEYTNSTSNFLKDGEEGDQTSWEARFPAEFALAIDENDIEVNVDYQIEESREFSFTIIIEEGVYDTEIDDTQWELACYDWSSVDFVDKDDESVGFYVGDSDPLYTQLITEEFSEDETDITWTRISEVDSVTKTTKGSTQPSGHAYYDNSVAIDIQGEQSNWEVKDFNDKLEVYDLDTIIASWTHPFDPRDFAYDTTFIFNKNALNLSMDPNKGSTIVINASDIGSTSEQLVITLTFPDNPQVMIPAEQTSAMGFYSVSYDLEERLIEYNNQDITIYGEFEDHTGKMIYDTLELKVRLPLWPDFGAIYDRDGDGRADYVKYFFPAELSRDQGFETHEIFWASDTVSATYLIGDDYEDRDEFGIELSPPLEYGVTRGFNSDGSGLSDVCVVYKSVPDCRGIELRDSIGPIVLSAWIMKAEKVLKLVTSEPLDANGSEDEYVYRIRNGKESAPDLLGGKQDDIKAYEWLISIDPNDPEISVGDSVKLAFGDDAVFMDQAGNYAHSDNPPVRVQLDLTGDANLLLNILRSVVDYSPEESEDHVDYVLARQERLEEMRNDGGSDNSNEKGDESFLVYWNNADGGELNEVHDNDDGFSKPAGAGDRYDTTAVVGPTFTLDIELPHYDGMASPDSDNSQEDDQRKSIEEEITIEFTCMFYDQLGQYIGKKHNKMVFEDASMFNELEQMSLLFEWMPEVKEGKLQIASSSGRYIPTGVIIAVAKYTAIGVVKEDFPPLKKGDARSASETQVVRFGYIRQ